MSEQPIIVRWLWEDCPHADGERAFVVEIPIGRMDGHLPEGMTDADLAEYLDRVALQVQRWPGTVSEGHVTCVVATDGRMLQTFQDPWFPYSNLWNGYCPLLRLGVRVDALEQLKAIPEERIREAHDVDLASIWCLEPGSWDVTELEEASA